MNIECPSSRHFQRLIFPIVGWDYSDILVHLVFCQNRKFLGLSQHLSVFIIIGPVLQNRQNYYSSIRIVTRGLFCAPPANSITTRSETTSASRNTLPLVQISSCSPAIITISGFVGRCTPSGVLFFFMLVAGRISPSTFNALSQLPTTTAASLTATSLVLYVIGSTLTCCPTIFLTERLIPHTN